MIRVLNQVEIQHRYLYREKLLIELCFPINEKQTKTVASCKILDSGSDSELIKTSALYLKTMSQKQTLETRLKKAIASSIEDEEIKRHEIISRAVYQIIKEDHNGSKVKHNGWLQLRIQRTPASGWSVWNEPG